MRVSAGAFVCTVVWVQRSSAAALSEMQSLPCILECNQALWMRVQYSNRRCVHAAAIVVGTVSGDEDVPSDTDSLRAPSQTQQDRWEACSTDSEVPELHATSRARGGPAAAAGAGGQHGAARRVGGARGISSNPMSPQPEVSGAASENGAASTATGAAGGGVSSVRSPMVGSTPLHVVSRYSYLSSDGVWTAKHYGLLNLAIVILIVTNFR